MKILKATPLITEKGMKMKDQDTYLFRVDDKTTKTELKKYLEKMFEVKVQSVRIAKSYQRSRINMLTRSRYMVPTMKKIYVRLQAGGKLPEELFKLSGE